MEKTPIIITLAIMGIGIALFFATGVYKQDMANTFYTDMRIKAAYAPTGELKLFALARNNELAKLEADGRSIPSRDAMVIGAAEAQMMKDEALFTNIGDPISGLFGIDTKVGGVLKPTNSTIDDMHFLSAEQYNALQGEERVEVRLLEGMPKIFYYLPVDEQSKMKLELAEGDIGQYKLTEINGSTYYPLMIGSAEAAMMKEESLFQQPGDVINGFFGTNVIIVGVIKQTNTGLDMMHVMPQEAFE